MQNATPRRITRRSLIWFDEVCHRLFINSRKAAELDNINPALASFAL